MLLVPSLLLFTKFQTLSYIWHKSCFSWKPFHYIPFPILNYLMVTFWYIPLGFLISVCIIQSGQMLHTLTHTYNSLVTMKWFVPWFSEFWPVTYYSPFVWGYTVPTKYESWKKCVLMKICSQCLRYSETIKLFYIAN